MNLYGHRRQHGVSLIELLIAVLIGMLLLVGIVSLFSTTSDVSRMENGLARLQENGRFAIERITRDLRMATSGRGMRKDALAPVGQIYGDRGIVSHVDFGQPQRLQHGLPGNPGEPNSYTITPSFMMHGYECDAGGCAPAAAPGPAGNGADHYGGGLPAQGTTAGARAQGADALTVRYLRGVGVGLAPATQLNGIDGGVIPLAEAIDIGPSGLVVIGDHQTTIIVSVGESNGSFSELTLSGNISNDISSIEGLDGDIRVSDFDSDFMTVSYFLRLTDDPSVPGRLISTLVRRVNGEAQEIAQGIERLDFLYHIEGSDGTVAVLTADQLYDAATTTMCPNLSAVSMLPESVLTMERPFCGWRMVRSVEVFLLANTIDNTASNEEPFLYSFLSSGEINEDSTPEVACNAAPCYAATPVTSLISGLPPERMMRREFRSIATLRNNAI